MAKKMSKKARNEEQKRLEKLEVLAQKVTKVALRQEYAQTGSKCVYDALIAASWTNKQAQDSTNAADCLQAARFCLYEQLMIDGHEISATLGYTKSGKKITPFTLASSEVKRVIRRIAKMGMTGTASEIYNQYDRTIDYSSENVDGSISYTDDISEMEIMNHFHGEYNAIARDLSDGYKLKEIAIRQRICLSRIYQKRDKMARDLLKTGFYDRYK